MLYILQESYLEAFISGDMKPDDDQLLHKAECNKLEESKELTPGANHVLAIHNSGDETTSINYKIDIQTQGGGGGGVNIGMKSLLICFNRLRCYYWNSHWSCGCCSTCRYNCCCSCRVGYEKEE